MKHIIRIPALILSVFLLTVSVLGCKTAEQPAGGKTDAPVEQTTPAPDGTVSPEQTADAEPVFTQEAADAFDALDREIFCWYVTMDGYSFHQYVSDPSSFDIDPTSVNMTLGEFSEEDSAKLAGEASVFLEKLNAISRDNLDETRQFSYDVLEQYLTDAAIVGYEYMYEPLTAYSGLQANLPIAFMIFDFENKQDIEDYLTLLADMPRYLDQVLDYERKRAELGYFMTEDALDEILQDIDTIIAAKDTSYLYGTFEDGLEKLASEISAEEAAAYKARNESIIQNEYIGAFSTLRAGLEALRSECGAYQSVASRGTEHKEYFEYSMRSAANNELTVEETLDLLKDTFSYLLNDWITLYTANPDLATVEDNATTGSTEGDIKLIKEVASKFLPELPEHNLNLIDVPKELENSSSPAAYIIPAIDNWKDNLVLINQVSNATDPTVILTFAHECYPGHLYESVYHRSMDSLSLMQRAMYLGGYNEGWAQLSEWLVANNQTTMDSDYLRFYFDYMIAFNALLPAIMSIQVNYYDYSKEAVSSYISGLGLNPDAFIDIFYPTVIDQPYYFFDYAIGYAQLDTLRRDAETDLGDAFDLAAFLQQYLSYGPGYFNLLQERMDVWVDAQMQEADAA